MARGGVGWGSTVRGGVGWGGTVRGEVRWRGIGRDRTGWLHTQAQKIASPAKRSTSPPFFMITELMFERYLFSKVQSVMVCFACRTCWLSH